MISTDLVFTSSNHSTISELLANRHILKDAHRFETLSMELKYTLVRLSSLGVLEFHEDRIQVVEGMEAWINMYWREVTSTWSEMPL